MYCYAIFVFLLPFCTVVISSFLGIFFGIDAAIPKYSYRSLHYIFYFMFIVNIALGVFNILPAFPMDGGRVVRSLFYVCMTLKRATQGTCWLLLCARNMVNDRRPSAF